MRNNLLLSTFLSPAWEKNRKVRGAMQFLPYNSGAIIIAANRIWVHSNNIL
jgi:hypothetical protein